MRRHRYLLAGLLLLLAATPLTGAGVAMAEPSQSPAPAPVGFANPAFQSIWARTDSLVADGSAQRTWFWGPAPFTSTRETYYASPNGTRLVQYFDKSRMEIKDPYANPADQWFVTNGLLVKELITGQMQTSDDRFKAWSDGPAEIPVAGDPLEQNPNAPTYRTLLPIASLNNDRRSPSRIGESVGQTLDKQGNLGQNSALAAYPGTRIVYYDDNLGHNIPEALWSFMTQNGPVRSGGQVVNAPIVNWVFAMGYPITEPFWTKVTVGGAEKDVLMQAFERRVLTYTPSNPDGWQVEMGNVGRHYFLWRHGTQIPPQGARPETPLRGPHIGYGFNASLYYTDRDRVLDAVQDAGFSWIRQQVEWKDLEISPGVYAWDELDRIVDSVSARNLHLLLSVVKAPSSLTPDGRNGMPANPADFQRLMQAMASRYFGRVDAYEMWNEQNTQGETAGDINPGKYVEMLKAGYTGVKSGDPYAIVVYGGLTPTSNMDQYAMDDVVYLERTYQYQNGAMRDYFDVLGVHPGSNNNSPDQMWPDNPGPGPGWRDKPSFYFRRLEQLRDVMVRYGDANKQMWLTEFGWTTKNAAPGYEYGNQISDQLQAQYIVRAFQKGKNDYPFMGVMALWNLNYATVVPPTDEKYPWSVLNGDWTPRPAYTAIKNMPK